MILPWNRRRIETSETEEHPMDSSEATGNTLRVIVTSRLWARTCLRTDAAVGTVYGADQMMERRNPTWILRRPGPLGTVVELSPNGARS